MSFLFFFFPKTTCSLLRPGLHTRNSRAQYNLYICTYCTVHTLFASYSLFSRSTPGTSSSYLILLLPMVQKTQRETWTWFTIFHAVLALGTQSMTQMRRTTSALTSILRNTTLVSLARHSFRVDFSPQDEGILHQQVDDVVEESHPATAVCSSQLYLLAVKWRMAVGRFWPFCCGAATREHFSWASRTPGKRAQRP